MNAILESFGINFHNLHGRNYFWNTIGSYATFELSFLGIGRNSVHYILATRHPYMNVGGVHNDILKLFVENGFLMFSGWLFYYFLFLPKQIYKRLGTPTMKLFYLLTVYKVIIYATDNIETYFISQYFYLLIVLIYFRKAELENYISSEGEQYRDKNYKKVNT